MTMAEGMVSGAFDENSHKPDSMPVIFHSPDGCDVVVCSLAPANCSPRNPVRLSARIDPLAIGAPAVLFSDPLRRCAICASTGATTHTHNATINTVNVLRMPASVSQCNGVVYFL